MPNYEKLRYLAPGRDALERSAKEGLAAREKEYVGRFGCVLVLCLPSCFSWISSSFIEKVQKVGVHSFFLFDSEGRSAMYRGEVEFLDNDTSTLWLRVRNDPDFPIVSTSTDMSLVQAHPLSSRKGQW